MTDAKGGENGQFKPVPKAQAQDLPGTEQAMEPSSESTILEGSGSFVEYAAAGKLKGKKALITGGDSGIGRSVAILFARKGADVTIVYLPEEEDDARETKEYVQKEGKSCLLYAGNLMDNATCESSVQKHIEEYGQIDILVNNASKQIMCSDFAQIDLDIVESTFRNNILQMFAITKFSLSHMPKAPRMNQFIPRTYVPLADGGSIINTTSTVALRGTKSMVDYAATKGAITSFTRSLAKNLLPKGIRVNAVAPGPVHTPLQPASRPAEQIQGFGKDSQIERPGQPSEIAPSFVFLASNDSELYYGQVLHAYPLGD